MTSFSEALKVQRGITAIIGSGGKTSLLYRLADELSKHGTVLITTTTHIFRPDHLPFAETADGTVPLLCVGTPCENGKITRPKQSFDELLRLADYVLVEADGSRRLPIKAHDTHEPVIPENADQVICVVGASGLYKNAQQCVHRPQIFTALTGEETATPKAVAALLQTENLHTRVLINQIDVAEQAARELASLLTCPTVLASLQKGDILCSF